MKGQQLKNLSANTLQLILNQVFGLVIFYVLSTGLSKYSFGQINLALAILLSAFNILSFGMDQIVIKKIAADDDSQSSLSLYISHVLFTGLLFYGILAAGILLFPANNIYNLLLLIGIGKLMIYFSTPFKQAANGMEQFKLLAYLSVISNAIRCICLIFFMVIGALNLSAIITIFIVGDTLEFLIGWYLFKQSATIPVKIKWDKTAYLQLLRESLPQTGVVLITSALSRFDWIFIGFMLSAVKLAEYSFAYKIFEMATLPLLAIAPLLIPCFTKMIKQNNINGDGLQFLIRMEFIVAAFVALLLNICWSPVIDALTAGKYGAVNVNTIFILSICMPLLYLNNFLWTIYFAQGRLKMILHSFVATLIVNVAGNLILIPIYKNEGAAIAFLLGCITQAIFYLNKNTIVQLKTIWQPLIVCTACAWGSGFGARIVFPDNWMVLPFAVLVYAILLVICRQIRLNDKGSLKAILN